MLFLTIRKTLWNQGTHLLAPRSASADYRVPTHEAIDIQPRRLPVIAIALPLGSSIPPATNAVILGATITFGTVPISSANLRCTPLEKLGSSGSSPRRTLLSTATARTGTGWRRMFAGY